ncbi:MAG: hypothetical protein N3E38_00955 [Candidatus Aenigmarchaeota archaeon]|nr:hypothetical protein [Candidatus Aenigmarchaeota archaeon]
MKGQTFIVEYIIMFGIAFAIFSTLSYIFYSQTEFLSSKIGENSAKLINKLSLMSISKAYACKGCDNIIIYQEIPEKIGGVNYNITFNKQQIQVILFHTRINSTTFNINETFDFSGNMNSKNKKAEIKINNKIKLIQVK